MSGAAASDRHYGCHVSSLAGDRRHSHCGWRQRPLSDTERLLNNGHLLEPDDPKIMTSSVLPIAIAPYIKDKGNLKSFRSTCIEVKIWAKIGMSSYPVDSARGQSLSLRNNVFFCWDAG